MIPFMPWHERTFRFDMPLRMFPAVLERLRDMPLRVSSRLRGASQEQRTRRVAAGWSAQEHAGHLLDYGALDSRRLDEYLAGEPRLTPADPRNARTHEADHNSASLESLLRAIEQERDHFVRRLESLDDRTLARIAIHPRLGVPMRLVDFAFFVAEHDDHHIVVMSALIRETSAPSTGTAERRA